MGKTLYVGNLGHEVTGGNLTDLFAPHGTVQSARIMMDRTTGRSRGFGLVEMKTAEEAVAATTALNGQDSGGRALNIREARLRPRGGRNGTSKGVQRP
jgi:cold-inducible RNA-binding protein